jgi:hypothetical protein
VDAEIRLEDLARETSLGEATIRELTRVGLLAGHPEAGGASMSFDPADAAISRLIAEVLADDALRPTDLEPVVELVRELVRYEHALLGFATTGLEGREAVARRNRLYRALHALHTHLYARMIVHDEPA